MVDKLCVTERRLKILEILTVNRQSTREKLATEFNVSSRTIARDIEFLSIIAPIVTKKGNQGGVYIMPNYKGYNYYLSEQEENCLYTLMEKANREECRILCGIILKFTKSCPYKDRECHAEKSTFFGSG